MRVIRALLVTLAIVLLLIGAATALLLSEPGRAAARGAIESWVSAKLGRTLRIDGDFEVRLGRSIGITAADVHLANVEWARPGDLFSAARVTVEVDAVSLLARAPTLVVDQIRVDGLDLRLERNADGASNWEFDVAPSEPGSRWLTALPVVVDRVALPGARLEFVSPRLDRPLELRFDALHQQRGEGDMLEVTGTGTANGTELHLSGRWGPYAQLIEAKNFNVVLGARLGEVNLSVNARVDDLSRPVDSEAHVELHGPDAAYVAATLGVRNLGNGPFDLALSVSPAPEGNGIRGSVVGRIGEFDVSGDGELSEPTQMSKLVFHTEVSGPDVSLLGAVIGVDLLPAERFRLLASMRRTGDLLRLDQAELHLPDSELSVTGSIARVDRLAGSDLVIHVDGASVEKFRRMLRLPGIATGPFEIDATLHPTPSGEDRLDLRAKTALLSLTAAGPLGAYPDFVGTRLDTSVSGPSFEPIARELGLRVAPRVAFTGAAQFEWASSGATLHGATLTVGSDSLNLDGLIGKAPQFDATLRFGAQGSSLDSLAAFIGWSGFPKRPYRASGQLARRDDRMQLDAIDLAAADARLQLSGTLAPSLAQDSTLRFVFEGADLAPFAALVPDVALPRGAFRTQGSTTFSNRRVQLRNVIVAVAGADAAGSADVALPLGSPARAGENWIDVRANGPDLKRLAPDVPESAVARQHFDLRAKASWDAGAWTFDPLHFVTPAGSLNLQGRIDRAPDYSATQLRVDARTTDLAAIGRWFGVVLPNQPLTVVGTISGTPSAFRAEQLAGTFGASDFRGSVNLDLAAKPKLEVQLHAGVLDLAPLTDAITGESSQSTPARRDEHAIPDVAIPVAWMNRLDGSAKIDAATALFLGQTYADLRLDAALRDGVLTVDPLAFGSAIGNLTLRLTVGSAASPQNVRLAINGSRVRLGLIPGMNRTTGVSDYDVDVDLAGTGLDLRTLAATLDGRMDFVGTGGRIPNSTVNALTNDFLSQLVRTLNPFAKRREFTDVVCQAYLFEAGNGKLTTSPAIVVRTSELDVVSSGTIELNSEAIDFNFKTMARGGLGFSAGELLNSYVKVSGTLSKPRLTVDATGTLVNGGAAFATGGLSILASTLWDRISRQKDPCASARDEAGRRAVKRTRWW